VKVVVLSGGVGGARFVRGVVDVADPNDVTVIGNVGDDLEVLGMRVSPDLDSILYALAGLNDEISRQPAKSHQSGDCRLQQVCPGTDAVSNLGREYCQQHRENGACQHGKGRRCGRYDDGLKILNTLARFSQKLLDKRLIWRPADLETVVPKLRRLRVHNHGRRDDFRRERRFPEWFEPLLLLR